MNVELVSRGMGVAELREGVEGAVLVPGDAGYDAARACWNLRVTQEPRVIVEAETVRDVQAAVRFARSNGLPVAAMATGHGMPRGCDGVLVRLSRMTGVHVDAATRLATFEGGALAQDVLEAAAPFGLAMLSGSSPRVGAVGYTLGGGFGLMVRKHGLAIDRVRSARVVTPDGEVVTASATQNADLFWAIRGGGGAFGIVVSMVAELVPQAMVYGGVTFYPAESAPQVLRAYAAWTRDLPEEVSPTAFLMNLPPLPTLPTPLQGRAVVAVNACVCGDLREAEALVRPMRELGTPLLDHWGAMPYIASGCIFNDPTDPMPGIIRGAMVDDLTPETVERLLDAVGPLDAMPQVAIQIRLLRGAAGRVGHEETPIGCYREAGALVYTVGAPNPYATVGTIEDHAESVFRALGEAVMCRGPLNFIGEGSVTAAAVRGAYGAEEYARLRRVKVSIDPKNLFRFASVGLID